MGHSPRVVFVLTVQVHDAEPEASADFVTRPCAELGPLAYVTVIAQEAFGSVAIVTAPVLPRETGERTDVNRTNAAGVAGACVGAVVVVTGFGVWVGALVVTDTLIAGLGTSVPGVVCGEVVCSDVAVDAGRVVGTAVAAAVPLGATVTIAFSGNVARAAGLAFASPADTLQPAQTSAIKKRAPLRPT